MANQPPRSKAEDIVVFEIVRDSACAECGAELWRGEWLRLENGRPLCLTCADLDHLVLVRRGNAALTRRASKYSNLRAVLVRFSRSRKRYERQGVLVEEAALGQAEEECLADSDARARKRERRADYDKVVDAQYRADFARHIVNQYPGCPPHEAASIAEHACRKHSGRVGRTSAAKHFDPEALDLAVRAYVRHRHTPYDKLLGTGFERTDARSAVASRTDEVLSAWRTVRT